MQNYLYTSVFYQNMRNAEPKNGFFCFTQDEYLKKKRATHYIEEPEIK